MRRSVVPTFLLLVSFLVVLGCGAGATSVSGKVTAQGKTVVWGNVSIVASDNISYPATIQDDGTFTIAKIPVGPCKIGVTSPNPEGNGLPEPTKDANLMTVKVPGPSGRPKPASGKWFDLPDQFRDPMTSGLTGVIKKGEPLNVVIP